MKFSKKEVDFLGINVKAIDDESCMATMEKKNRLPVRIVCLVIIFLRIFLAVFYKI